MTDHYFSKEPTSGHEERVIQCTLRGQMFSFETDAGVFSKARVDPGSETLIEAVSDVNGRALDLGCGWGAIGISLAKAFKEAHFVLADVNERAVSLARSNMARNRVSNAEAVQSDGLSSVEGEFDAAFLNPPIRAGKVVVYRLFSVVYERLCSGGMLYVVIRKQQGAASAQKFLEGVFGNAALIARSRGYHVIQCIKE